MKCKADSKGRPNKAAFLLLLAALQIFGLATTATAGETERFVFSPHPVTIGNARRTSFELAVPVGGTIRDSVAILNKTANPIQMRVYGADAERAPDGALNVSPFGSSPRAGGRFVKADSDRVEVAAHSQKVVGFTVSRPTAQTMLAAIVAQEVTAEGSNQQPIELVTRVALLVKIGATSGLRLLEVERVRIKAPLRIFPSSAVVSTQVINHTSESVSIELTSSIRTLTGRKFELGKNPITLRSGQSRTVNFTWNSVPRWGAIAKAESVVEWGPQKITKSSARTAIIPLWMLIGLIAAEIYLVLRLRRRGGLVKESLP